jgi:hypothetical protein
MGSIANLILKIRQEHGFGSKRISIDLARHFHLELFPPTIWRVLQKYASPLIKRYWKSSDYIQYNRPLDTYCSKKTLSILFLSILYPFYLKLYRCDVREKAL